MSMEILRLLLFSISVLPLLICGDENGPIVSTLLGKIAGIYETSYKGREYSAFYGIPYAKPPIGDNRFREPQVISSWQGIWNANHTNIMCVQVMHHPEPEGGLYTGDEDCLYLNIFVPSKNPAKIDKTELLDVIVHIHGGGLMFGGSTAYAGPRFLMDEDIVFVTFNYRLGVLGFLSTEDDVLPGNNGMKDQVLALEWIRDHIKNFGGNPDCVTLTGLSAGGASVHLHYLSPLSRGLFHRGISFSGNALVPWIIQEEALEKARIIGGNLGCTHQKTQKLVQCMRQRSTRRLVESIRLFRPWLLNPFSPFGLVIEGEGKRKFLTRHPYFLLKRAKFIDVPWMTGLTSEEGLYPAADYLNKDSYLPELEKRWLELAPHILDYNYTAKPEVKNEVSKKLKEEYLENQPISKKTFKLLLELMSDRLFCLSGEKSARFQATMGRSPVFLFYFTYEGEEMESHSIHFAGHDQSVGVSHGDDTMYILSNPNNRENPMKRLTAKDEQMKEILVKMVASFAKKGTPTINKVQWIPVNKNPNLPLMHLRFKSPSDIGMEDVRKTDRHRAMWATIPLAENENLFPDIIKDEF